MERLQDRLHHWLDGKPARVQGWNVAAGLAVLCVVAALGSFLGRNPVSITLGSLCGLGMALLLKEGFTLLPAGTQERWNLADRFPFRTRRWVIGFMAAILVTVLIGAGRSLPYALGGAVTVCAAILLVLAFLPTAAEVAEMELEAQEAAEAAERAATTPEWDGSDPEEEQEPPNEQPLNGKVHN